MKRRWRLWLGLAVLIVLICFLGPWTFYFLRGWFYGVIPPPQPADDPPFSHRLAKVEQDTRPAFHIDPKKPYRIELGRGSGWHGLDTVKISEDGAVVLYRNQEAASVAAWSQGPWYKATMQLSAESLAKVLQAVEDNHLLALHKAYHADVADGTQWVLWIKQGDEEKSVYFNNHFPQEIVRFAGAVDAVLADSGSSNFTWYPVLGSSRDHEKELWNSIKR
jgi:hypothetical protein